MMNTYITFFIALCIAGLVADILHLFAKMAVWLGVVLVKKTAQVNFKPNIWIGAILSLFIAVYFLFV